MPKDRTDFVLEGMGLVKSTPGPKVLILKNTVEGSVYWVFDETMMMEIERGKTMGGNIAIELPEGYESSHNLVVRVRKAGYIPFEYKGRLKGRLKREVLVIQPIDTHYTPNFVD